MNITLEASTLGNGYSLAQLTNGSGDLLSEEMYHTISYVCTGYIGQFISLVGVPANFITCLVFWRQGLKDRMNLCLFSLASVDLLFVASDIPGASLFLFSYLTHSAVAEEYFVKYVQSTIGWICGLRATSGCYNMIIAVERCVCVVFPFKAGFLLRTRTTGVLLAACFVLLQLGFLVDVLQTRCVSVEVGGTTKWVYAPTQMYLDNKDLFQAIELSVMTVSLPTITFIGVSVSAVVTAIKLKAAMHWRERTASMCSDKLGQQTALTKMILVVSFIYIFTMIPSVALTFTRLAVSEFSFSGRFYYLFLATSQLGYHLPRIHSSSNFFVYYNQSSRFRSFLKAVCCFKNANKERRFDIDFIENKRQIMD